MPKKVDAEDSPQCLKQHQANLKSKKRGKGESDKMTKKKREEKESKERGGGEKRNEARKRDVGK